MRRIIAGVVLGLVGLAGAVPLAGAHSQHVLSWEGRGDEPKLRDGDVVLGTDFLRLKINTSDPITGWKIEMVHEASGLTSFCEGGATDENSPTFECNWDTRHVGNMTPVALNQTLAGAPPSANGAYRVTGRVSAKNCGLVGLTCSQPEEHVTTPFNVTVTNPLSKPAAPTQSFNSASRTLGVTWNANPEPDIARYVLQERFNDGDWIDKYDGPATSFERAGDPGSYQYRVVAHRPHSQGVISDATSRIEVAAPAPPPDPVPAAVAPEPGTPMPGADDTTTTAGGQSPTTGARGTTATTKPRGKESPRSLGGSTLFRPPSAGAVKPSTATTRPKTTPTTVDDGFEEALVYPTTAPPLVAVEVPGGEAIQVPREIVERRPVDPRSLLIPLAGGLAVFVFAMQVTFMTRRRPAFVTADDDFGDWA